MKLSIAVVTMNRVKQLIEALQSCIDCIIPEDTEFVIIDNASTDDTAVAVEQFFVNHRYYYYYERLEENIGCGNGRNYAYSKSHGDYIYFLDDDAYIDTLTTQIYDLVWKKDRVDSIGPKIADDLYKVYMFCGGSHFLKKDFFKNTRPYYANKYGYEEIFPSLSVYNEGFVNAFTSELLIIHNPLVNKWSEKSKGGIRLAATGMAQTFLMRSALFPVLLKPLNFLALFARLVSRMSWDLTTNTVSIIRNTTIDKRGKATLKYSTVFKLFHDFRFSIF